MSLHMDFPILMAMMIAFIPLHFIRLYYTSYDFEIREAKPSPII